MRMLLVEDEKKVSELVARALRAERNAPQPSGADPNDPLED
jgi:DNA-binding response OmpR family regulator